MDSQKKAFDSVPVKIITFLMDDGLQFINIPGFECCNKFLDFPSEIFNAVQVRCLWWPL